MSMTMLQQKPNQSLIEYLPLAMVILKMPYSTCNRNVRFFVDTRTKFFIDKSTNVIYEESTGMIVKPEANSPNQYKIVEVADDGYGLPKGYICVCKNDSIEEAKQRLLAYAKDITDENIRNNQSELERLKRAISANKNSLRKLNNFKDK